MIWYIVFLFSTVCHEGAHALAAKLLHAPTHALAHAREEERDALAELLPRIYHIPRPE